MRVAVISLAESEDRRASIGPQLEAVGIRYSFFEAIDAQHGFDYFKRYDPAAFLMNTGRSASAHEAACYASHLSLWKVSVASGEPILVLEDDAELLPQFRAALALAAELTPRYGFLRLQTYGHARHVRTTPVETVGAFTVVHCPSFPFGAMAYALCPRVAEAFVAHSTTLASPLDLFIKKFWEHGQPLFALSPGSVHGGPLSSRSTILQREKHRLLPTLRFKRFLAKCTDVVRRARFNRTVSRDIPRSGSVRPARPLGSEPLARR